MASLMFYKILNLTKIPVETAPSSKNGRNIHDSIAILHLL